MTWALATLLGFALFIFSIVGFFLYVYKNEYDREERIFKEVKRLQELQAKFDNSQLTYILTDPAIVNSASHLNTKHKQSHGEYDSGSIANNSGKTKKDVN